MTTLNVVVVSDALNELLRKASGVDKALGLKESATRAQQQVFHHSEHGGPFPVQPVLHALVTALLPRKSRLSEAALRALAQLLASQVIPGEGVFDQIVAGAHSGKLFAWAVVEALCHTLLGVDDRVVQTAALDCLSLLSLDFRFALAGPVLAKAVQSCFNARLTADNTGVQLKAGVVTREILLLRVVRQFVRLAPLAYGSVPATAAAATAGATASTTRRATPTAAEPTESEGVAGGEGDAARFGGSVGAERPLNSSFVAHSGGAAAAPAVPAGSLYRSSTALPVPAGSSADDEPTVYAEVVVDGCEPLPWHSADRLLSDAPQATKNAVLLLRTLCALAARPIPDTASRPGTVEVRTRDYALELLVAFFRDIPASMLWGSKPSAHALGGLLALVQGDLWLAIGRNVASVAPASYFDRAVELLTELCVKCHHPLQNELHAFLTSALFPLARSQESSFQQKSKALDLVAAVLQDPVVFLSYFINADCNPWFSDPARLPGFLEPLVSFVVEMQFIDFVRDGWFTTDQATLLRESCVSIFHAFSAGLVRWVIEDPTGDECTSQKATQRQLQQQPPRTLADASENPLGGGPVVAASAAGATNGFLSSSDADHSEHMPRAETAAPDPSAFYAEWSSGVIGITSPTTPGVPDMSQLVVTHEQLSTEDALGSPVDTGGSGHDRPAHTRRRGGEGQHDRSASFGAGSSVGGQEAPLEANASWRSVHVRGASFDSAHGQPHSRGGPTKSAASAGGTGGSACGGGGGGGWFVRHSGLGSPLPQPPSIPLPPYHWRHLHQQHCNKRLLLEAAARFDTNWKHARTFLVEYGVIPDSPAALARFIRSTPSLPSGIFATIFEKILKDAQSFALLEAFMATRDFANVPLDIALRDMSLEVSGLDGRPQFEAQVWDRIQEVFGNAYATQNNYSISISDAQTLGGAVLFLHTSLHNAKVGWADRMTEAQWVKLGGECVQQRTSSDELKAIYRRVAARRWGPTDESGGGGAATPSASTTGAGGTSGTATAAPTGASVAPLDATSGSGDARSGTGTGAGGGGGGDASSGSSSAAKGSGAPDANLDQYSRQLGNLNAVQVTQVLFLRRANRGLAAFEAAVAALRRQRGVPQLPYCYPFYAHHARLVFRRFAPSVLAVCYLGLRLLATAPAVCLVQQTYRNLADVAAQFGLPLRDWQAAAERLVQRCLRQPDAVRLGTPGLDSRVTLFLMSLQ